MVRASAIAPAEEPASEAPRAQAVRSPFHSGDPLEDVEEETGIAATEVEKACLGGAFGQARILGVATAEHRQRLDLCSEADEPAARGVDRMLRPLPGRRRRHHEPRTRRRRSEQPLVAVLIAGREFRPPDESQQAAHGDTA
jgi:hypothetical protein